VCACVCVCVCVHFVRAVVFWSDKAAKALFIHASNYNFSLALILHAADAVQAFIQL